MTWYLEGNPGVFSVFEGGTVGQGVGICSAYVEGFLIFVLAAWK